MKWSLPVVGVFVSPTLTFGERGKWLYLRPIGLGYYMLGKFASAKLTITDRPGRLDVSGSAPGLTSAIGFTYPHDKWKFVVELGYRGLQFNDATLQPREGFPPESGGIAITQASTLPQQLDYSGLMARAGVLLRF